MPKLAGWALSPLFRLWVASKAEEMLSFPRPFDVPLSHAAGSLGDSVLIVGGGVASGWGVRSHQLGLPGFLARALNRRTGRGADVHVVSTPFLKIRSAPSAFDGLRLERFDAVVVSFGVNDAITLTSLSTWTRDLAELIRIVEARTSPSVPIIVLGVPPITSMPMFDSPLGVYADRHGRAMNARTAHLCASSTRASFVPLSAAIAARHRDSRVTADYRHWAEQIANQLAPELNRMHAKRHPEGIGRSGETSVAGVSIPPATSTTADRVLDPGIPWRFDALVSHARAAFGVDSATFSVITPDRVAHRAQVGEVPAVIDLAESFSATVIEGRDGLIVPDASRDPRFSRLPHVVGEPRIRFYAGFPIDTPDGRRLGTLNLFDPEPRENVAASDHSLLRQLGNLIQAEIYRGGID